jgi:endonuclease/exonuclease/phosphatase family metal-dependent hydrolase
VLSLLLAGCGGAADSLTLVSYNVQNLFDGEHTGAEYAGFTPESGWDGERYYTRLTRLAHVLTRLAAPRADVIVLQEVENHRIISDLVHDFLRHRYTVVAGAWDQGPNRVYILSRLPVRSCRAHGSVGVAVRPEGGAARVLWSDRAMVDVELAAPFGTLRLLGCHWKSQSGGERETEPRRQAAAALLRASLDQRAALPLIIAGDLNEDVDEYDQHAGAWPTALMPAGRTSGGPDWIAGALLVTDRPEAAGWRGATPVFYSPWYAAEAAGSYRHGGQWERLDQALFLPPADESAKALRWEVKLRVVDHPELLGGDGPRRYDPRSGSGYSDHLPIVVTVARVRELAGTRRPE